MAMTPPQSPLASCSDSEKALILTRLLDGDPTLRKRAEDIARRILGSVDITTVSDLIVEAILELDTEDLANRAGPRRHGYVEPTDAAWQLLEETIEPWIDDLRRRARLGLHQAAADLATALTQALETAAERADGIDDCLLRQWAPDFPVETASWVERELNATIATSSPTGTSI
jgi:hypothetical protein